MAARSQGPGVLVLAFLVTAGGCVAAPEAGRDGGTPCVAESDCNDGATCGLLRRCVAGACSDDRTLRACPDGRYPDASTAVGECLTYIDCNRILCGALIPCVGLRCDPRAPTLNIPCGDAGADAF
ncbi:MAG: hypothetical protein R3A48_01555 [Polyangiales bacterium]